MSLRRKKRPDGKRLALIQLLLSADRGDAAPPPCLVSPSTRYQSGADSRRIKCFSQLARDRARYLWYADKRSWLSGVRTIKQCRGLAELVASGRLCRRPTTTTLPRCHSNCHSHHFSVTAWVKEGEGTKRDRSDKSAALISCVGSNLTTLIWC